MNFSHPWLMAIGVAVAALPVVMHFLTRPRSVRMPISTVRFVFEAVRQNSARHRLRDIIILALRTLAILLIAAAIARPQFGEQPLVFDEQSGAAVRVVVLDVSQSMAATHSGVQRFEKARTVAVQYLRYRPGLKANLILAGAKPVSVFDEPSTNFDALRDELSAAQALPQRLDVNAALERASEMLAPTSENDQRRRELIVISDFQRSNWAKADFDLLPTETQLQLESAADAGPAENIALLGVSCRGRSSERRDVTLEVEVGNYGKTERQQEVEVVVGETSFRLSGNCPPGQRTTISETIRLQKPGWQTGMARLLDVDDALSADDQRPLVVEVRQKPLYVLLTRQTENAAGTSSHFLECALMPDKRLGDEATTRLVRVAPTTADHGTLAMADLILLDHPGKLPEETTNLLVSLLRRGRPVIYVASELIDATNLKRISDAAGGSLRMPVEFLLPPAGQPRRDLFLASVAHDRLPFNVFGDSAGAIAGRLRFSGGLSSRRLDSGLVDDVLASYGDGTACLVLTASDMGALAVINADLAASNLPTSGAFVPLLEELVQHLLQQNRGTDVAVCGELLVAQLPSEIQSAAGLRVLDADRDAPSKVGDWGELVQESVGVTWRWTSPDAPGAYRIESDEGPVFAQAVTIPTEESPLDAIPASVLKDRLAAGRNVYVRDHDDTRNQDDNWWTWLLAACVACMLLEIVMLTTTRQ